VKGGIVIDNLLRELKELGLDVEIKIYLVGDNVVYNVRYKVAHVLYEPWSSERANSYAAMIDNLGTLVELYS